jgi:predicted Zn-dependent protease
VLGDALFRLGKLADAQSRLDRVIAFDPGNATALRAQAELALKTGNSSRAIVAAQKLVTVLPKSADDRLLLARSYTAAGNTPWANRTLWAAFQEIPANDAIYAALISQRKGDPDATQQLRDEFGRQRYAQLSRGIF